MDDLGVVTRSRRRLSVELTEETASPSTPTKKRATKLAVKPQLDNINENAVVESPRRVTRRSFAPDNDERTLTPTRRSTRVRSNTSLTDAVIESPKPRRVTRKTSTTGSEVDASPQNTPTKKDHRRDISPSPKNTSKNKGKKQSIELKPTEANEISHNDTNIIDSSNVTDQTVPINKEKEKHNETKNIELNKVLSPQKAECIEVKSLSPEPAFEGEFLPRKSPRLTTKTKSPTLPESTKTVESDKTTPIKNTSFKNSKEEKLINSSDIDLLDKIKDYNSFLNTKNINKTVPNLNHNSNKKIIRSKSLCSIENALDEIFLSDNEKRKSKKLDGSLKTEINVIGDTIQSIKVSGRKSTDLSSTILNKTGVDIEPMEIDESFQYDQMNEIQVSTKEKRNKSNNSVESSDINTSHNENSFSNHYQSVDRKSFNSSSKKKSLKAIDEFTLNLTLENMNTTNTPEVKKESNRSHNGKQIIEHDLTILNKSTSKKETPKKEKLTTTCVATSTPVIPESTLNNFERKISQQHTKDLISSDKSKSSLIESEAEDAGDGYESGDSINSSEREYAKSNDIPIKGESLGSSSESDNESDEYEKDSFVVSSDEIDEDLLDGTGDDLSMSDKELTQSKKSKDKYNARMKKQQKGASREMFEARHGMSRNENKSNQDSASDNDDTELVMKLPKTVNRKRLDSSMCSNPTLNEEREITVTSNMSFKQDPLLKSFEIKEEVESLQVSKVEEMEVVEVGRKETTLVSNNISKDPLSNTNQLDSESYDDSSISENEQIMADYSNMLANLNASNVQGKEPENKSIVEDKDDETENSKKPENKSIVEGKDDETETSKMSVIKGVEMVKENKKDKIRKNKSLSDMSEETENSKDNSLLQRLNLTNIKYRNRTKLSKENFKKNVTAEQDNESASSDEMGIKLLFDEDESEDNSIPIHRVQGKTNLLDSMDTIENNVNVAQVQNVYNESNEEEEMKVVEIAKIKKKQKVYNTNESFEAKTINKKKKLNQTHTEEPVVHVKVSGTTNSEKNTMLRRLAQNVIDELNDTNKPLKKAVISTSKFDVDLVSKRRNKPSRNMDESILVKDEPKTTGNAGLITVTQKSNIKPSIPYVKLSKEGYTTQFQIVTITKPKMKSSIQISDNVHNYKQDQVFSKRIKRMAPDEYLRKFKKIKMSKF